MILKTIFQVLIGSVALLFAIVAYRVLDIAGAFDPVPYKDVRVESVYVSEDRLFLTASFIKTDCKLERFGAFGLQLGSADILSFRDEDGISENHDRLQGAQTLHVSVEAPEGDYSSIEFRTEHNCDGRIIQKVFASFDIADVEVRK